MPGQEAACIQPTNQTIAPGIAYLRQAEKHFNFRRWPVPYCRRLLE